MNYKDAKVIIGGGLIFEQTVHDYPRVEAYAILDPRYCEGRYKAPNNFTIKDIIFNPPATIVFWSDNTKTVVKADNEPYDPEKGIAMAISKKMIGDNKFEYYNTFLHWLKKWNKQRETIEKETTNV